MRMKIQYTCHLCFIWQYQPCVIYIHLHTICLIGMTELGTATFHFAPNRRRFHWSISQWILLRGKNLFGKSYKSNLSLFLPYSLLTKNTKSCIFAHSGIISLIYLFVCMYISYKAHNRWTNETFLIGSDVDVNMFSALTSIPSGTIDIILKRCIWTVTNCDTIVAICDLSQFVIKAVTWHIDSNNTENVLWVLGRVPMFTFDMNMKSSIFADSGVISLVHLFVSISVIKPIIDVQRKPSWEGPMLMWTSFLQLGVNLLAQLTSIWKVVFWTVTNCDSHKLRH